MSTFEKGNQKKIFFVSTFLDWYKAIPKSGMNDLVRIDCFKNIFELLIRNTKTSERKMFNLIEKWPEKMLNNTSKTTE